LLPIEFQRRASFHTGVEPRTWGRVKGWPRVVRIVHLPSHGFVGPWQKRRQCAEGDADVNTRNDRAQALCRSEAAGPGLLASRWFWGGGLMSLGAWAWLLGKIGA
jgi:hypothetical protein